MNISKLNMTLIFGTILISSFSIVVPIHAEIQFEDATKFSGISYNGKSWGSSWGDFNGDGWADLWLGNHNGKNANLYVNNADGTFSDLASEVFQDYSMGVDIHGASWADFDNDGDQDLILLSGAKRGIGERPNLFFINEDGKLKDQAKEFGLDFPLGRGRTPLWLDWNKDGLLDIVISNFPRPDGQAPTSLFTQTAKGFEDNTTFFCLIF